MIALYKPTPRNTGLAISFQASDRDGKLYCNLIKQSSWDAQKKKGSFIENRNKPGFSTTIKFSQTEAATMMDAVERHYEFKGYHSSESFNTQITFGPAQPKNEGEEAPTLFVFKATQTDTQENSNKSSYFISLTYGEARLIKEYLVHYLHKSFRLQNAKHQPSAQQPVKQVKSQEPVAAPQEQESPTEEKPQETNEQQVPAGEDW